MNIDKLLKKKFVWMLLSTLFLQWNLCMGQNYAPEAVAKNNEAVKLRNKLTEKKDIEKAVRLLDEAIAIDPSYKLAYTNKARFLMYLGEKEKALNTILQMEEMDAENPYYLVYKGMLLEENAKKKLATAAYTQAVSLYEKRLKEKPAEADLINYVLALYLRDNKKYTWEEMEKKYPVAVDPSARQFTIKMMNGFYDQDRKELVHEMIGGKKVERKLK